MAEVEEFAEALLDQLSIEINEEKDIADLFQKINEDASFSVKFDKLEDAVTKIFPETKKRLEEFFGISVPSALNVEFPSLVEFKKLKGKKVFANNESSLFVGELFLAVATEDQKKIAELIKKDAAKFLVYSTYAKAYISKISTTYGDYLDDAIYLNRFILSCYPQIILYKQGRPYESRFESVNSGYYGALKMTILEEQIHAVQDNLQKTNKEAVIQVNSINEDLARIILQLDNETSSKLSDYLKLPIVPDEFPIARRANLFFTLNPDNFIVNVLGPDVMTFTKVEIDPKISEMIPQLLEVYQDWLKPIQTHHAAFTTMEGMADFAVQNILKDDDDFQNYLTTFVGSDSSSYKVRKNIGSDFTNAVFEKFGKKSFQMLDDNPPTTRELKNPQLYLKRIQN